MACGLPLLRALLTGVTRVACSEHLYSLQMIWPPPASQLHHPWLICICKREFLSLFSFITRYISCSSLPSSPVNAHHRAAWASLQGFMTFSWDIHLLHSPPSPRQHPSLNWTSSKLCFTQTKAKLANIHQRERSLSKPQRLSVFQQPADPSWCLVMREKRSMVGQKFLTWISEAYQ